jgi:DNA-binding MarR family transcriptional regulator
MPSRLARLPSRLLGLAAMQADRLVAAGLATVGARKWHYAVLAALDEFGPASQALLSRRSRIYRSDLVAILNELSDQGHIERTTDTRDQRRNVISLTARGHKHLQRLDLLVTQVQDDLLATLEPDERVQLNALLGRVLADLGERYDGNW